MTLNIAWGITGCGDRLEETLRLMEQINKECDVKIDVYLSKNAVLVIKKYDLFKELKKHFEVTIERGPNTPFIIADLQLGKFDLLIICPATGNTTAKIAYGIADTLLSNAVAQAMKTQLPIYIYPADQKEGDIITKLPDGRELTLTMRNIDIENTEKLKRMAGINVIETPQRIKEIIPQWHQDPVTK